MKKRQPPAKKAGKPSKRAFGNVHPDGGPTITQSVKARAKGAKKPTAKFATEAERLAATDPDQYNTERAFAAEHIVQDLLEGMHGPLTFESPEDEEGFGSCELDGVTDARDADGRGGAWVSVKIYVPNLDIDTEINR